MISLAQSQQVVNEVLSSFLHEQRVAAEAIHSSYGRLYEEIERVVFAGGKRLRPHLVFVGYGTYDESAAMVAAAHELLHVALLIHDDIIDRDTLRHGQATIHHSYDSVHYAPFLDSQSERHHFSTSAALLAGDLLISSAYELIRRANLSMDTYQKVAQLMSTGVFEVAGGELLDSDSPFIPCTYAPILFYRYKTTGYSFIAPLLSGVMLSMHTSTEDIERLRTYATNLGIAYQIKDDYLGVFGETTKTGKSTTGDLREGKRTFLIAEFEKVANDEQRQVFGELFGNPHATEEQLIHLKTILKESGAADESVHLENEFSQKALAAVAQIEDVSLRENLLSLTKFLNERDT
jgi:geranylgeranyl diphosphate synthase type II